MTKKGCFGPSWKDGIRCFTQTQGEMDALLMEEIMPSLMGMFSNWMEMHDLPHEHELLTVFTEIRAFAKSTDRKVSWTLAFTVHCILTSILEVEGSKHLTFLAKTSRKAFENVIKQLEWTQEASTRRCCTTCLSTRRESICFLRLLVWASNERAWNPLCAGSLLLYVAYGENLEKGTTALNCVGQLQVYVRLFDALLDKGAIVSGQFPTLEWINDTFDGCWRLQNVALSDGEVVSVMTVAVDLLSHSFGEVCRPYADSLPGLFPGAVSRFRRDFGRSSVKWLAHQAIDALQAMRFDRPLLATNTAALGCYLKKFYVTLLKAWTMSDEDLSFATMAKVFNEILSRVRAGDEYALSFCTESMVDFFCSIPETKVRWFRPSEV
jgi:hypothetical protein